MEYLRVRDYLNPNQEIPIPSEAGHIMLVSGFEHLSNPFAFLRSIDNYRIVDVSLSYYLAAFLPMLQLTLAFMLVFAVCREGSRTSVALLFSTYLVAQLSAILRGLDIECGCFGQSGSKITWFSVTFVATLTTASAILAYRSLIGRRTSNLTQRRHPPKVTPLASLENVPD